MYEKADIRIMTLNVQFSGRESDERTTHIINLVRDNIPSVICFQEYEARCYTKIGDKISNDYAVAFDKHSDNKTVIYTPIYYRTDILTLIGSGGGWLDSRYKGTNTKSYSWAVLKIRNSDKIFAVTNCHGAVASNAYSGYEVYTLKQLDALQQKWTLDNVRQLFDIIASIKNEYGDIPFISVGDFNFEQGMPAYKAAIAGGFVEAETHATISKCVDVRTTHTIGEKATAGASIDHIFYYPNRITAYVHYIGATTKDELYASDHFMVYADMRFNE